jgi:hypothetical protein
LPVAAKIAFASAGRALGNPISPAPLGSAVLSIITTSTSGASRERSSG